MHKEVDLEEVQ